MSDKPPLKKKSGKSSKKKGSRPSSPSRSPKSPKSPSSPKSNKSRSSSPTSSRRAESPQAKAPQTAVNPASICQAHKKEFKLFSETLEVPICEECLVSPPLNGIHSKVVPIEEAHRYRLAAVYNTLNSHLFSKREQLMAQMHRVDYRLDEIKRVKMMIERDMKSEFSAMNERLNSSCGTKIAILQHDIAELNGDLERINNIIQTIENSGQDMIGFLQQAGHLRDAIEISVAKPFRTDIDVYQESLPRELAEIRSMVEKFPALQAIVAFKDELIWKLLHERSGTGDIDVTTQKELAEWARLTDKFSQELEKFKLNCEYCGVPMDDETVNSNCPKNSSYSLKPLESSTPSGYHGNNRHYFSRNKPQKPEPQHKNLDSKFQNTQNPSSSPPEKDLNSAVRAIGAISKERGIDLENLFKPYDVLNLGLISPTDFYQILSRNFGLSGNQINTMVYEYDPNRSGRIQYNLLIRDTLGEIPAVFDKLHLKANSFLDSCRKADSLTEGMLKQEAFKDVLRSQGLSQEETREVLNVVELSSQGLVPYLNFYNRIK